MPFRPGELDQKISIERSSNVSDGMGGNVTTWAEVFAPWALVRPMSGNEKTDFNQVYGDANYLFVVRYPLAVLDRDRIVWDGDYYNIRFRKKPTGRKKYMQITAERGVAQ
jgi:SPP1 family predicted phage head-tail adaptor